ncbi:MAG: ABC transporter substrate-binding protein [Peptococcaceae bacterium]|nr:ABC transporter substrate-binding protein [Peptococcaceae bacterium]
MKRSALVLGVLLVCALMLAGCGTSGQDESGQAGPKEILIGINAPLTGIHAGFGEGNVYGEKAAVDDINALGGVYVKEYDRRIPVKAIVLDNESDPGKSMTLEENLITQYKVHVLAPPNQPIDLAIPQAIVAERYGVPRVSGGTPNEPWQAARKEAKPTWEHTFTYTLSIAEPAPAGSPYDKPGYTVLSAREAMTKKYGPLTNKKVGLFASDEPDGRGWYEAFPKMLKDWGYEVVGVDRNVGLFPLDATDFSSIINEWQKNNVEMVWGNCPGPLFGALWRQARSMGFKPKIVWSTRAGLFYEDVSAWGGDLPLGIGTETWWDPSWKGLPGINGTTPMSLYERWVKDTGKPLNPGIGWGYHGMQIVLDAIERAGSLDPEKIVQALKKTDMATISNPRVVFDERNACLMPQTFSQWQKTDKKHVWESKTVFSQHDFAPVTGEYLFPIPYEK